jgi:hypothetical protein
MENFFEGSNHPAVARLARYNDREPTNARIHIRQPNHHRVKCRSRVSSKGNDPRQSHCRSWV